jgi:hypothetical protein
MQADRQKEISTVPKMDAKELIRTRTAGFIEIFFSPLASWWLKPLSVEFHGRRLAASTDMQRFQCRVQRIDGRVHFDRRSDSRLDRNEL